MVKVLLVEDQEVNQLVAKFLLTKANAEIDVASSGQQALELASANSYDLIFMDLGLPDTDGYTVALSIREKGNTVTPIIALTAHTDEKSKSKALQSGMNDFFEKPLDFGKVQEIFSKFLIK